METKHHLGTDEMVALVESCPEHRRAHAAGYCNRDRAEFCGAIRELAGTENTLARAWAMGNDGRRSDMQGRSRNRYPW